MNSTAWDDVAARSRYEYYRAFNLVLRCRRTTGAELGSAPLSTISARGVDKLYRKLQVGTRVARRLRQANVCMLRMQKPGMWSDACTLKWCHQTIRSAV